jgi:hypothetical protein
VESVLLGMEQQQRLKFAGDALCEIAEVCQMRARLCWADWQEQHTEEGPVLDGNFLEGLTRDSMYLDLSGVLKPLKGREKGRSDEGVDGDEPMVQEVSKDVALLMAAEAEAEEALDIQALEYDEDVGAWAAIVRGWMEIKGVDAIGFLELWDEVGLSVVKVWLALLLGGFELRQSGGFYEMEGVAIALASNGVEA